MCESSLVRGWFPNWNWVHENVLSSFHLMNYRFYCIELLGWVRDVYIRLFLVYPACDILKLSEIKLKISLVPGSNPFTYIMSLEVSYLDSGSHMKAGSSPYLVTKSFIVAVENFRKHTGTLGISWFKNLMSSATRSGYVGFKVKKTMSARRLEQFGSHTSSGHSSRKVT